MFSELNLPDMFHLMGQCWASNIVLYFASKFPERVLSFFNVAPLGATSVKRVSNIGDYSFPADMLPKGLSPRKLMERRILMQENR